MRSVLEWVGKSDDEPVPPRVRIRVFNRDGWSCRNCNRGLVNRRACCDHEVAICNGGPNRETNLRTLCEQCHREKTKTDVGLKAKTYRIHRKRAGIRKTKGRPMPGARASRWKKKLNGTVERRDV